VVVVKGRNFEDSVEGFSGFLFPGSDGALKILVNLIPNDLYSFAMHLAFHFLDLFLLYTDLYSSVVHLRYEVVPL